MKATVKELWTSSERLLGMWEGCSRCQYEGVQGGRG